MKWRLTQPPYNLSPTQPILCRVFLCRDLVSTIQNVIVELSPNAVCRQFAREPFRQTVCKIDMLYAALMQQTGAGAPLRCSRNLAAIDHTVPRHRICEAPVAAVATALWAVVARWRLRRWTRHRRVATG